jgi:hypothetical protein
LKFSIRSVKHHAPAVLPTGKEPPVFPMRKSEKDLFLTKLNMSFSSEDYQQEEEIVLLINFTLKNF